MNPSQDMLDNPVYWSLSTRHRHLAHTQGSALALPPGVGPFAGIPGTRREELGDLATLVRKREHPALLMARHLPAGLDAQNLTHGVQMVLDCRLGCREDLNITTLGAGDAEQMFALTQRTRPGPFVRRTHNLGDFIGIKQGGALIAMAGQRLKLPGFTEISAVCVDRAYRGRGYGAALVLHMAARILAHGDQPFLHTYADNKRAISLYERLGFRLRADVKLVHLDKALVSKLLSKPPSHPASSRETAYG